MVIIFSVSALRDTFGLAVEPRSDLIKIPFKPSRLARSSHVSGMSVKPALCRQSGGGLVWIGLEDRPDLQPRYLIFTKHNNTEHQVRLDFFLCQRARKWRTPDSSLRRPFTRSTAVRSP